jgi:hypothetical protein
MMEATMPLYFFDIKDGHRLVDPKGQNLKNDAEAFAKAKVMAIGVSLDKPEVDPTRRIAAAGCAPVPIGAGVVNNR